MAVDLNKGNKKKVSLSKENHNTVAGGMSTGSGSFQNAHSDRSDNKHNSKSIMWILIPVLAIILIIMGGVLFKDNSNNERSAAENADSVVGQNDVTQVNGLESETDTSTVDNANDNTIMSDNGESVNTEENVASDESLNVTSADDNLFAKSDDESIHNYEIIIADVTWEEAFRDCLRKGGYLCRINSEEENETIKALLNDKNVRGVVYLGGLREEDSNDYHWVDANKEPFDDVLNSDEFKKYWLSGEPSFTDNVNGEEIKECYMSILYPGTVKDWLWNDVTNDVLSLSESYYKGKLAYICEFE